MKKFFLISLLAGTSLLLQAQWWTTEPRRSEFRQFYLLLTKWQKPVFTAPSGQVMAQRFSMEERNGILRHEWHPVQDTAGVEHWSNRTEIPLYTLDSFTQKQFEGMLFIHAAKTPMVSYGFDTLQRQYIVQDNPTHYTLFMRTSEVRNLPWQLLSSLNAARASYQRYLPKGPTDLVTSAVVAYFVRRGYPSSFVANMGADQSLYVGKCLICNGTKAACTQYVKLAENAATIPQDESIVEGFSTASKEERLRRLEWIVEQAITRYFYDYPGFTDLDIQHWNEKLEEQRKRSMSLAAGRKCASCDGATRKKSPL